MKDSAEYEKELMKENINLRREIDRRIKRVDVFFYGVLFGISLIQLISYFK